jgi:hypothetical protein
MLLENADSLDSGVVDDLRAIHASSDIITCLLHDVLDGAKLSSSKYVAQRNMTPFSDVFMCHQFVVDLRFLVLFYVTLFLVALHRVQ